MNNEQFDRWKDFALRMAKTAFKGQRRPCTRQIVEMVQEFFDDIESGAMSLDREYLAVIASWDNGAEYPEGHPYRGREYHRSYCGCDGYRHKHKGQPNPDCLECHGNGVHHAWTTGPILCDAVTGYDEHWMPRYWADDEGTQRWESRRDRWCGPPTCCIRAGFDLAVSPSMGVMGFTAGDLRRMYPDGVPDWVQNGDWDTVPIRGVCPGVGFVPGEPHSPKPFDEIPDNESVWL
jgi:hypothetical protein